MDYSYDDIANMIDHSLLQPAATDEELEHGCQVALDYNVASICIKPYYLARCSEILAGSTVKASTVIGFPHGGQVTSIKVAEADQALNDGGQELDMVVNIGKVLTGDWDFVRNDIKVINDLAHDRHQCVKVIFENCYLEDEQKLRLCEICGDLRVDFVKTSTGYGDSGSTNQDLRLMRRHSPEHVRVKAAGGIRTLDQLLEARTAGANRIGASRTAEILEDLKHRMESADS